MNHCWIRGGILVILILCTLVQAKIDNSDPPQLSKSSHGPSESGIKNHKGLEHIESRKQFTSTFMLRRKEQFGAVQSIENIETDKRRPFLEDVVRNIRKILEESRAVIARIDYKPSDGFPHDSETLLDAISKVLENTAFFSDLALRFSQVFENAMQKDRKLNTVVVWAFQFSKEIGLMDDDSNKVINLMAQQMGLIEKSKSFVNPHDKDRMKEELKQQDVDESHIKRQAKQDINKSTKQKKPDSSRVKSEL